MYALFEDNNRNLDNSVWTYNAYGTIDHGAIRRVKGIPGDVHEDMSKISAAFCEGKYLQGYIKWFWHWWWWLWW